VEKTITGKIVNEKGEPLEGVTVKVKGSSAATQSLTDGSYSIKNVSDQAVLVFHMLDMFL